MFVETVSYIQTSVKAFSLGSGWLIEDERLCFQLSDFHARVGNFEDSFTNSEKDKQKNPLPGNWSIC